jgi:Asp-tRNA(Asn)/Glu-tRNA(Gln) amidotransferase A subunit family amidase
VKKNLVKIWKEKKLDAIILPCMPFVGPKPEGTELIWNQLLYVAPSAAFDMPAGVITVTKVQKEEEIVAGKREDIVSEAFKFQCEGSAGMPVAIQVMGMSYEDEKILGIMKQVDNIWNFREKVPLTDLV